MDSSMDENSDDQSEISASESSKILVDEFEPEVGKFMLL